MTYHRTQHTVTADRAIEYLLAHEVNHACITKDGILATSWEGHGPADGDGWYEVTMVFPLDDDGRASSRAIRSWLGY